MPSRPTSWSLVIGTENSTERSSGGDNGVPGGNTTSRCLRPLSAGRSASRDSRAKALNSATQGTRMSREIQITPSLPPGRSTRVISGTARPGSSQCQAAEITTASTDAAGSGISSPRPASTSASGLLAASTARIRSSGSTATTRAARPMSSLVTTPVPAARSRTACAPGGISQSSACGGGGGR